MNNAIILLVINTKTDERQTTTCNRHLHLWVGKYCDEVRCRVQMVFELNDCITCCGCVTAEIVPRSVCVDG